ncbi:MAG: A/G-specific adenine glycosylase [bacterium]|nr:A/G-specific adenine glycosylase [bacterium]
MKISSKLLRWYDKSGRVLPWRGTRDPYRILVSEIMLQQTQVTRVLLFYKKWLKRFPNWTELANASNADVILAWAGLGYNRRALVLRDIAKEVVAHGVPASREEWLQLKGVGPYTASALTIFSLRQRSLPIDTNIRRVLGRLFLGLPYSQPNDDPTFQLKGWELLETERFYDVPQALFDLAAIHCTKVPDCASCPLRKDCRSAQVFLRGEVVVPKRMNKKTYERKHRNKPYPDRIYRGRLLRLVRESDGFLVREIGKKIDKDFDPKLDAKWLHAMIKRMKNDKLVIIELGKVFLSNV